MDNKATQHIAAQRLTKDKAPSKEATVKISAHQLRNIADLLDIIDGFLRSDTIADHLTDYLHATGADQPRQPHGTSHNTGLLIDLISLNAHNLRAHQRKPLQ